MCPMSPPHRPGPPAAPGPPVVTGLWDLVLGKKGGGAHDIHRPHGLSPLHPHGRTACGWRRGGCGWDVVPILMSTHAVGSFPFKKVGMFDQQQLCFLEVFHFVVLNKDPDSSSE